MFDSSSRQLPEDSELSEEQEEAIEAFRLKIDAYCKSAIRGVKEHPRAEQRITHLGEVFKNMVENYIVAGAIPEIEVQTKEEIENSLAPKIGKKEEKRQRPEK